MVDMHQRSRKWYICISEAENGRYESAKKKRVDMHQRRRKWCFGGNEKRIGGDGRREETHERDHLNGRSRRRRNECWGGCEERCPRRPS
eukprot:4018133-Pleurochrysis_carterae.AAC.1